MSITDNFQKLKQWRQRVREEGASSDLCHEGYEITGGACSTLSALLCIVKEQVDDAVWEGLNSDDTSEYFAALNAAMGMEGDDE